MAGETLELIGERIVSFENDSKGSARSLTKIVERARRSDPEAKLLDANPGVVSGRFLTTKSKLFDDLLKRLGNAPFFLFDTAVQYPQEPRSLVFSSSLGLQILAESPSLSCDATFGIVGREFNQLWSIHAKIGWLVVLSRSVQVQSFERLFSC